MPGFETKCHVVCESKIVATVTVSDWTDVYELKDGDYFLWNNNLWFIISHDDDKYLTVIRIGHWFDGVIFLPSNYKEIQKHDSNHDSFNGYCDVKKVSFET